MQLKKINTLPQAAQSPDLNSIKNLWQRTAAILNKSKPRTTQEFMKGIVEGWHGVIELKELEKFSLSMPKCCHLLIENKGWLIKY